MQNQVISEMLLDRREEWQNNTISAMQERLNSHPAGRYLIADYKKSLVVVYGNSQIGKTSLILNMMGIRPEHRENVYKVLRAHQEYGDSSTVTAIMYMISPTENYGMSFSVDGNKEITFYSESEIMEFLSELRKDVEKGLREERLLYIFIPRNYFEDEVLEKNMFSIMDLPGINSRNELEKDYVNDIVSRYMSMATVKMVVTKGDSIQDLASIDVPEGVDWRVFPNKYFVVVTMAFSQGSVKNYFDKVKEKRTNNFIEYVTKSYADITQIVNSSDIEWYPIDVGESFQNLLQTYKDDAKEIIDTQKYFMDEIRKAIVRRKGNGLRNIIEDLRLYSRDYYRVNISSLEKIIKDREENIECKKLCLVKVIEEKKQYEDFLSEFTIEDINNFHKLGKLNLTPFIDGLLDEIEKFINFIAENYPPRIKDHDCKILDSYLAFVNATVDNCSTLKTTIGDSIYEDLYSGGIADILKNEIGDILEQQKIELTNMLRPKGVNFFFSKIDRTDVISRLLSMSELWKNRIITKIKDDLEPILKGTDSEKERYIQTNQLLEYKKNEENKLNLEIRILESGLAENKNDLHMWEKKEKMDTDLLATYYNVANLEYMKCKSQIKKEMKDCSIDRKLQYMMLLGLMEQDYNAIIEGD